LVWDLTTANRIVVRRLGGGLLFALGISTGAGACGDKAPPPQQRDTSRLSTAASGRFDTPVLNSASGWKFASEMRIDGEAEVLEPITWIAIAPHRWVALAQPQSQTIRFFDLNGNALGQLGREGAGPAEFRNLGRWAGWMADTLWVWDPQLRRITLISPDRHFVRTVNFSQLRMRSSRAPGLPMFERVLNLRSVFPNGSALVEGTPERPLPAGYDSARHQVALLHVSWEGVVNRLLDWLPPDEGMGSWSSADGQSGAGFRFPFYPRPLVAASPDGKYLGMAIARIEGTDAGSYDVTVLQSTGDTVFASRYPFRREPLSLEDAERLRQLAREAEARGGASAAAASRARFPTLYSPITELRMGTDGSVWLQLRSTTYERAWLVLSANGEPLDTIVVPRHLRLVGADTRTLWFVQTDSLDVPSLVRYGIRRDSRSNM
jgi:hypothetical protein